MKTYTVPVIKTVSGYVTVQASSKDEALQLINTMPDIDNEMEVSDADIEVMSDEIEEN